MRILESSENYLESIYILGIKNGTVRSIDIANHLSFSKASVSVAMKQLRENDYVTVDDAGAIKLLPKGMEIAKAMYERHVLLTKMLESFGVPKEIANQDACKIEHVISKETLEAIRVFMDGRTQS